MESRESRWLKNVFRETDYSSGHCPPAKRMKFSDVSTELCTQFPDRKYSAYEISRIVHEAFPHTESKPCGKSRLKHILGLERVTPTPIATTSIPDLQRVTPAACEACTPLPGASGPIATSSIPDLLIEIQQLKERVMELEKTSAASLCHQADAIIQHKSVVTQAELT